MTIFHGQSNMAEAMGANAVQVSALGAPAAMGGRHLAAQHVSSAPQAAADAEEASDRAAKLTNARAKADLMAKCAAQSQSPPVGKELPQRPEEGSPAAEGASAETKKASRSVSKAREAYEAKMQLSKERAAAEEADKAPPAALEATHSVSRQDLLQDYEARRRDMCDIMARATRPLAAEEPKEVKAAREAEKERIRQEVSAEARAESVQTPSDLARARSLAEDLEAKTKAQYREYLANRREVTWEVAQTTEPPPAEEDEKAKLTIKPAALEVLDTSDGSGEEQPIQREGAEEEAVQEGAESTRLSADQMEEVADVAPPPQGPREGVEECTAETVFNQEQDEIAGVSGAKKRFVDEKAEEIHPSLHEMREEEPSQPTGHEKETSESRHAAETLLVQDDGEQEDEEDEDEEANGSARYADEERIAEDSDDSDLPPLSKALSAGMRERAAAEGAAAAAAARTEAEAAERRRRAALEARAAEERAAAAAAAAAEEARLAEEARRRGEEEARREMEAKVAEEKAKAEEERAAAAAEKKLAEEARRMEEAKALRKLEAKVAEERAAAAAAAAAAAKKRPVEEVDRRKKVERGQREAEEVATNAKGPSAKEPDQVPPEVEAAAREVDERRHQELKAKREAEGRAVQERLAKMKALKAEAQARREREEQEEIAKEARQKAPQEPPLNRGARASPAVEEVKERAAASPPKEEVEEVEEVAEKSPEVPAAAPGKEEEQEHEEVEATTAEDAEEDNEPDLPICSATAAFPSEVESALEELAAAAGSAKGQAQAKLKLGRIKLASAKYAEAEKLAEEASTLFDEGKDDDRQSGGEAEAERLIIQVSLAEEKFEGALEVARECLSHWRKTGARKSEAIVCLALAEVHMEMERPKEARRVARRALETFKELKEEALSRGGQYEDHGWLATAQKITARAGIKLGTPFAAKQAFTEAEEALNFFRIVGDTTEEATTLLLTAEACALRQECETAASKASAAVKLCREMGNKKGEALALREFTKQVIRDDPACALELSQEALQACQEVVDPLGELETRHLIAAAQISSDKADEALTTLKAALKLARELQDRKQIGLAIDAISQLYVEREQTQKALSLLQGEVKLASESGDARRHFAALQRVTNLHLALNKPDDALRQAQDAVTLFGKSERKLQAWSKQLLAEMQFYTGRFSDALDSTAKAKTILREEGETKSLTDTLQLEAMIYTDMENLEKAIASRKEQRQVYKDAGWKDEEAAALLAEAELVGPKEAVKLCREVVELYQGAKDAEGEAAALLDLANARVAAKEQTEALNSAKSAVGKFHALGDIVGEASAMQTAAKVYESSGSIDSALKLINEGRKICKNGKEKVGESIALQEKLQVHLRVFARDQEHNRKPQPQSIEDAVTAARELAELQESLQDSAGQIAALIQLSGIHQVAQNGEKALQAADEALQLAIQVDKAHEVGMALVAMTEAHILLEDGEKALEAADTAIPLFREIGDQDNVDVAEQLALVAKELKANPPKPQPTAGSSSSPPEASARGRAEWEEKKRASARTGAPPASALGGASHSSRQASQSGPGRPDALARQGARGSGGAEDGPPSRQARRRWEEDRLATSIPDQELKRQQLRAATDTRSAAPAALMNYAEDSSAANTSLRSELKACVPRWSAKELDGVEEKLRSISIGTVEELYRQVRLQGRAGMNRKLTDAGKSTFGYETWKAFESRANKQHLEMID